MSNKKLFFLGRFPAQKEVGGVITFTQNFADYFKNRAITYVDIYPSKGKKIYPENISILFLTGFLVKRLCKLFFLNSRSTENWIFNFSTLNSLYLLYLLPKKKYQKWLVILHNGDHEQKFEAANFFQKHMIKSAFKKIDFLGAISGKQFNFYKEMEANKIFKISPQIGLPTPVCLEKINNRREVIFLMSGYPTKIYRIIETMEIFSEIFIENTGFQLNICLYGKDSDLIKKDILLLSKKLKFVNIYENLDASAFKSILISSDVYIRMNSVDSYGLVVAEAIESGLEVIATDVCERYPGAHLIKVDDFQSLKNEIIFFLDNGSFSKKLSIQEKDHNLTDFEYILDKILI